MNLYLEFFGFSEKPFNITPDPRFLFLTAGHQEALAALFYGIKERKGFIALTGEVGTGKTTVLYKLLYSLDPSVKPIYLFHSKLTFHELLRSVLFELQIDANENDKLLLIRKLNDYLIASLYRNENVVLIIDEAQNLSAEVMEEIRMLSNLETPSSKLLQIIFVGQPELETRLNSADLRQLRQRISIKRRIPPLTQEESRAYIDHRLRLVGSSSSKVITSEAEFLIVSHGSGIPRVINVICDNAFLIGYGMSQKKLDAAIVREALKDLDTDGEAGVARDRTDGKMARNKRAIERLRHLLAQVISKKEEMRATMQTRIRG